MESTIVKATDILLGQPEETLIDKDNLIITGIIKGMDCFNKICKTALQYRHKEYSEAKKEELGIELTKILFYTGCLVHLCDGIDPSVFGIEELTAFSMELPEDIQEDSILASMQGIRNFIDICEDVFTFSNDDSLENNEIRENNGENEDESDNIEQAIAEIFACVIILCDHFDLDLESVMHNVATIKKL